MGQFFNSKAKIGALSESSGTITLADSHLRIGGQGYTTSSLDLSVGTATAGTLYMIYAVVSGGVVSLVKSTNVNSVGPATYTEWALVGAFYTGAADTFGAFVTIEGSPMSDWESFTPELTAASSNPALGTGSYAEGYYKLVGDCMEIMSTLRFGTSGTGNGSGTYYLPVPLGLTADSTKIQDVQATGPLGWAEVRDDNTADTWICKVSYASSSGEIYMSTSQSTATGNVSDSFPFTFSTQDAIRLKYTIPIAGWSSTPIKDR